MQHGHVGLVVRHHFVPRLISASHVKTPALIRDQLEMRLDDYRVEVLDTSVVLRTKFQEKRQNFSPPSPPVILGCLSFAFFRFLQSLVLSLRSKIVIFLILGPQDISRAGFLYSRTVCQRNLFDERAMEDGTFQSNCNSFSRCDIHRFALSNGGREINESRLSFQLLALRMNDATRFHKLTYKTLVS